MKIFKKLIILNVFLLLLTTIIVLDSEVYAINTDDVIDDVIVTEVGYYGGVASLSPTTDYVRNDISQNNETIRVLYIASFNREVNIRIIATNSDDDYYDIGMLAIVYDYIDYNDYNAYVTLYDINGDIILDNRTYSLYYTLGLSFYINYDISTGTYMEGYNNAKEWYAYIDDGEYYSGNWAYSKGYEVSRDYYAYIDDGEYFTGNYAYNKGYNDGLDVDNQEAYNKGYIDGGNNAFHANLHVWIVPAIIIVIGLGGYLTIARNKRDE